MRVKITEIDFTEQILNRQMAQMAKDMYAAEKAGYPPKCNPGYEVSPDKKKCIPIKKDEAGWKKKKTK
jgi:glucan biosynthesis protein